MLLDDSDVPQVGLEPHVEEIAKDRDGSRGDFDADIRQHPGDLVAGDAEQASFVDDIKRDPGQDNVARRGRRTDQAVQAEPEPRAWDAERTVDGPGELLQTRQTASRRNR